MVWLGATGSNDATILKSGVGLERDAWAKAGTTTRRKQLFPKADCWLPIQSPPLVREHRLYEVTG